jgi:DNA-binding MarR family transcriptional regulator
VSGGSDFSPTVALLALSRRAEVRVAGLLEPRGLTLRGYLVLAAIAANPGVTRSALARRTGATTEGVDAAVRRLVSDGLVRSAASGSHARQLTATAAATPLLAELASGIAALDAELFDGPDLRAVADALLVATAEPAREPQD